MRIQRPDGSVITFKYDAFGRRISKSYHRREFLYIWDKNVPLHEIQKEELCEDNVITWVFEGFIPVAKLQGDKSYSIISDHIGTPLVAIDNEGVKVWERELDIYGKVRKLQGDKWFMPFLYQGQYYDVETELAYNRFRYYDPNTGSYISQDPIGLAGGNPTIYGYVFDGNTEVDVFGLELIYEDAPYHTTGNPTKSKRPKNGQTALKNSVQIKESSPRRIGIDVENEEIVVLDRTRVLNENGDELFHGHVRTFNELTEEMKAKLKKEKKVDNKGKIKTCSNKK